MKPPNSKPYKACPFRRKSAAGWLGASTPEEFVDTALADVYMPCHLEVDYEDAYWQDNLPRVHQCAGRAIFLSNTCKAPRDKTIVRLPPNTTDVFSNKQEFLEHHNELS